MLLADDIEAWPIAHRPSGLALDLWTRLRVCVLGSIWQVRCHRSAAATRHESFARRAVSSIAVESIIEAIQRDWQRTQGDIRQLDNGSFCSPTPRGGVDATPSSLFGSSTRSGCLRRTSAMSLDRATTKNWNSSSASTSRSLTQPDL